MRRMYPYILLGLVVLLGGGYLAGVRGMKETLGQQISNVDLSGVADGTYRGDYKSGRFAASVDVTVKDHKIVSVKSLGTVDKKTFDQYYAPAIDKIIANQSPRVDAVSGATATTKSLIKAVENALVGAGGRAKG